MTVTPPRFSVVTVVRNDSAGLRRTHESLAAQTFGDWEWLVQDGASSDGTADVAQSFADPRITARSEADGGIYDAMNRGLAAATGDWVVFMNAGDRFASADVLARLAQTISIEDHDIVFGETIMDFGTMELRRPARDPAYIWHGQPGMHQATLFATACHRRFAFDHHAFRISADYDALARMIAAGARCRSLALPIAIFEFRHAATSNRNKLRMIAEAARIQRTRLRSPWWRVGLSAARRSAASVAARVLTAVHHRRVQS